LAFSTMMRALAISCGLAGGLGAPEFSSGGKAVGDDLVRRPTLQDPLTPGIVGGVEPAQQLLKIAMEGDRDAQHLGLDAAVKAFHHAIGLLLAAQSTTLSAAKSGVAPSLIPVVQPYDSGLHRG
jgi:hypothetical protein